MRAWVGDRPAAPPPDLPPDPVAEGPDADPESVARKILLDQLTGRARTRKELDDKLASKGVPAEIATRLLDRFEEVGLVDDGAFARTWVSQRQSAAAARAWLRRALAQELRRKGIDDETAREVLGEIDPADEEAAARELVRRKLRSLRPGRRPDRHPPPGRDAGPQGLRLRAGVLGGPRRARRLRS